MCRLYNTGNLYDKKHFTLPQSEKRNHCMEKNLSGTKYYGRTDGEKIFLKNYFGPKKKKKTKKLKNVGYGFLKLCAEMEENEEPFLSLTLI